MIRMKVGPTEPGSFRHPAEYRMDLLPFGFSRRCGDELQQVYELRDVRFKVDRPRAVYFLIDFRSGDNSRGPGERSIKGNPFDEGPWKKAGCVTHGFLSRCHPNGIVQMADHLMR